MATPSRVLFVTHAYPRRGGDGAGAFVHHLATAIRDHGVEVRVLAPSAPGLEPSTTIDGIRVDRFRYAPRKWETLAYEGTMAEQVAASAAAKVALAGMIVAARNATRRVARQWRPDVVHAHWWFPCGIGAAWARSGTPLIVTMHGSDVRLATKSTLAPAMYRYVARRAAGMYAVSASLAEQARGLGGGEVGVAPMPANVELFPVGPEARERSVLFAGRLNLQKGIGDALRAFAMAPADVSLDVVGDGPDRGAMESLAAQLGLASRVRWHAALPQAALAGLYRRTAAVIAPSVGEGLGLVAIEAILSGAPVVAYDSGGLADTVTDGQTGRLVRPYDAEALGAALNDVLRSHPTGMDAGRRRLLETYAPGAASARYAEIYRMATR